MDLQRIEIELKKRLDYAYIWGRVQSDSFDYHTNFIYQTYSFEALLKLTANFNNSLKNYAFNRWYNFWSAKAVEYIFATHNNVEANKNAYDKYIDFSINQISFDHKTSKFPNGFKHSIEFALDHKRELILWLYRNQSQQKRKHLKNRLFIVLYNGESGEHWKIKSEIMYLKTKIDYYVENFSESNLCKFDFGKGEVLSDIIWVTKNIKSTI